MKVRIEREEKVALLKAIQRGTLDTDEIPNLYRSLCSNSDFIEELLRSGWDGNSPEDREELKKALAQHIRTSRMTDEELEERIAELSRKLDIIAD